MFQTCVCVCIYFYVSCCYSPQLQQGNVPVSYTVTAVPPHGLAAPLCSAQHIPPSCSSQQQVPACSVVFSAGQHYHPVREGHQATACGIGSMVLSYKGRYTFHFYGGSLLPSCGKDGPLQLICKRGLFFYFLTDFCFSLSLLFFSRCYRHVQCIICRFPMLFPHYCLVTLSS